MIHILNQILHNKTKQNITIIIKLSTSKILSIENSSKYIFFDYTIVFFFVCKTAEKKTTILEYFGE